LKDSIKFDQVADIYDCYVKADFDIPFFLRETEGFREEILELMCGTGRVSIPLLKAGRAMTCVDYSKGMLESFAKKIKNKDYKVNLVEMDVTMLNLNRTFGLAILPFHSITEILSVELQKKALRAISAHLYKGGIFILTLQNPKVRLKTADGKLRTIGEFETRENKRIVISSMNRYLPDEKVVSGFQTYEIYDSTNTLTEKRVLDINFRPVSDSELRILIRNTGLEIMTTFGDYSGNHFDEKESNFMIYKIVKI